MREKSIKFDIGKCQAKHILLVYLYSHTISLPQDLQLNNISYNNDPYSHAEFDAFKKTVEIPGMTIIL